MNFFVLAHTLDHPVYFLDLNYTTQEDDATWHWFLCLNTGAKAQIGTQHLRLFEPIEYSDIDKTQIAENTKC